MSPHLVCVGGEDHALRTSFFVAMREKGFRVTAVSSGDGAAFSRLGIAHRRFGFDRFSGGNGAWGNIKAIRAVLSELRPDIVQSFDTKPNLLTPLAVRGEIPVVRTINGLGWTFSSLAPRALALRPLYCCLQGLASLWTAATVFQNRDDKAFFERYAMVGRSRSQLIRSSGIDVDAFATARHRGSSASLMREQLGLQSAEVVMFIGRLTRQKGIPTLIDAVPRVIAARPDARFVLVGPRESEGPFAVEQSELDRYPSHVMALGPRRDVPALLGMSDVFAFPTQYREGIPRVLLEAGLAGLPIVASKMPGCGDVVEDGWNGYLVAPHDSDALASRIIDLLSDRAHAKLLGGRSIGLVRERFALPLVVDQYCDLYRDLLSAKPAGHLSHPATPERFKGDAALREPGEARQ